MPGNSSHNHLVHAQVILTYFEMHLISQFWSVLCLTSDSSHLGGRAAHCASNIASRGFVSTVLATRSQVLIQLGSVPFLPCMHLISILYSDPLSSGRQRFQVRYTACIFQTLLPHSQDATILFQEP